MDNSDLAKRMKTYESVPKNSLIRRMPVIIRIDGKAFHTFTRCFEKPFDSLLIKTMQDTMKYLCVNIQGCVLGYHQSDEISLLLIDYKSLNTEAFFGYEVQKVCSVTASIATLIFNRNFEANIDMFGRENIEDWDEGGTNRRLSDNERKILKQHEVYYKAKIRGAMFDSRCFNLTKEEVTNYFYWRQLDAIRNSIQMLGQSCFTQKQLQNKSCNEIKEMLLKEKGVNWDDYPTVMKRGSCVKYCGSDWVADDNIPIFAGEDREYIDKLVYIGE
jgi:tRNA(His) 5'-end guanylyltransferase